MRGRQARILRIARFAILLGIVVYLAMFLRRWEVQRIPPQDQSMYPSYAGGIRVIAERLAPGAPLDRGTDVIYTMEQDGTTYARFGRVQAIPGDEVGAKDGRITVNGAPVGPIAISGDAIGKERPIGNGRAVAVPEGRVLILAINAAETRYPDSRKLGFIPRGDVRSVIRAAMP
jgi:signal peptidase I